MQYIIAVVILAIAIAGFAEYGNLQEQALERTRTCVLAVARAQGYHGDVNSEEAWRLFAPTCSQI